jgi:hypothetical protein
MLRGQKARRKNMFQKVYICKGIQNEFDKGPFSGFGGGVYRCRVSAGTNRAIQTSKVTPPGGSRG